MAISHITNGIWVASSPPNFLSRMNIPFNPRLTNVLRKLTQNTEPTNFHIRIEIVDSQKRFSFHGVTDKAEWIFSPYAYHAWTRRHTRRIGFVGFAFSACYYFPNPMECRTVKMWTTSKTKDAFFEFCVANTWDSSINIHFHWEQIKFGRNW